MEDQARETDRVRVTGMQEAEEGISMEVVSELRSGEEASRRIQWGPVKEEPAKVRKVCAKPCGRRMEDGHQRSWRGPGVPVMCRVLRGPRSL